jgi:cell wall-associated NlpC family hydrolase
MVDYRSLIGRQWEYGKADCFTLVRDWFKLQGVELPDYERPKSTETCESIFLKEMPLQGFKAVTLQTRQPGDVLIMRMATRTPMHAAILLSDERILHQQRDSLSAVVPLSRYYLARVAAVFRYAASRPTAR